MRFKSAQERNSLNAKISFGGTVSVKSNSSKSVLDFLGRQNKKFSNFIYTKLSFRNYHYGLNSNIVFVAMLILFGTFIPKQVKLENQNENNTVISYTIVFRFVSVGILFRGRRQRFGVL